MIFLLDKDGRVLLNTENGNWGTFLFPTNGNVIIREMVCELLIEEGILTLNEYLEFSGIVDSGEKSIFVYSVKTFDLPESGLPQTYFWHSKNEIPYDRLRTVEEIIMPQIVSGIPIGIPILESP
ncbi:hypothetical protein H7X65_01530 [Candidatus Parcubacteria bacterium]|nr:hypothetical protein [Candidatus Parcubacteria bacterium]